MKPIILTYDKWMALKNDLADKNPPSVMIIRDAMKSKLGFTFRHHKQWEGGMVHFNEQVHLDFYDEKKYTMFLLKYSEYLNG
jgi:hypothetical protein